MQFLVTVLAGTTTLKPLPLASMPAQDWDQLASVLASRLATQKYADASWHNGALVLAIVAVLLLDVAVRVPALFAYWRTGKSSADRFSAGFDSAGRARLASARAVVQRPRQQRR